MPKILRRLVVYGLFFALFSMTFVQASFASPPAQDNTLGVTVVTDSQTGLNTFVGINSAVRGIGLPGATALQPGTPTPTAVNALADLSVYARQFGISNPRQDLQFMKASSYSQGS